MQLSNTFVVTISCISVILLYIVVQILSYYNINISSYIIYIGFYTFMLMTIFLTSKIEY